MPGSKTPPRTTVDSVLDEPWSTPVGTENDIKRHHRQLLPPGYPDELSRESTPETGSIGVKSHPISNREPPFKGMKRGR